MTEMKVQVSGEVPSEVLSEVRGQVGFITLNRPRALNALSLGMVRDLMGILLAWKDDARVLAVAIRGSNKEGPFGAFCAGGDIRFLHQAGSHRPDQTLPHRQHRWCRPSKPATHRHGQGSGSESSHHPRQGTGRSPSRA